jgi:pheromone shutdown protein TraB
MIIKRISDNLILIGTAHVLPESVKMVRETILREKPDIVGVELCPQRYAIISGSSRSLPASPIALALYLIQELFSRKTGVEAGEEMIEAIEAAREVGAKIEFLDKDINIILQKLLGLGLKEKLRFLGWLVAGFLFSPRMELSGLREENISSLLRIFEKMCPGFYHVLVQERDEHICSRILEISTGKKVICVIGAGHLPGIMQRLEKSWSLRWGWDMPFYLF